MYEKRVVCFRGIFQQSYDLIFEYEAPVDVSDAALPIASNEQPHGTNFRFF
jgi:hypothetical protein